ncbi:hypothetical protein QQX98_011880 [Neonectria punicea]|uniref:Metalloprotease n=1 Tax=Neonectria punicea TaxID=979145 RepID=A0ABR1GKT1_9HYPO
MSYSVTSGDLSGVFSHAATPDTNPSTVVPDETKITMEFTTMKDLFEKINNTTEDALIVHNVSLQDYHKIYQERQDQHRKFRLRRYYADRKLLIVCIPTEGHEIGHAQLYLAIMYSMKDMGVESEFSPVQGATYKALGRPSGDKGEGDSAGKPRLAYDGTCDGGSPPQIIKSK